MLQGSFSQATVREITRDAPSYIVAQLVGKDRVHTRGVGSEEEIRRYRLGNGDKYDRNCFAVMNPDGQIASAVYMHKGYAPVKSARDLHGNLAEILTTEATRVDATPTHGALYSISTIRKDIKGAGKALIAGVYGHLSTDYPDLIKYTLSPLRSFDRSWTEQDHENFSGMSPIEQKRIALDYILTGRDDVTQFHMGNGARPWDIKLGSGDVSEDEETGELRRHWVTVNYYYHQPLETLRQCADIFNEAKRFIRDVSLDVGARLQAVRDCMYPLISPMLLDETDHKPSKTGSSYSPALQQRNLDL